MDSVTGRLNVIVTYSISILIAMSIAMALSSNAVYRSEDAVSIGTIQINTVHQLKSMHYSGNDKAVVSLDLVADMRPLWHWNVKQLFVYLVAEYESSNVPSIRSEGVDDDDDDDEWIDDSGTTTDRKTRFVLWDKIIRSREQSVLKLANQRSKYALVDIGANLRGKPLSLHLEWNVIPYIGQMYTQRSSVSSSTVLPKNYMGHSNRHRYYDPDDFVPMPH